MATENDQITPPVRDWLAPAETEPSTTPVKDWLAPQKNEAPKKDWFEPQQPSNPRSEIPPVRDWLDPNPESTNSILPALPAAPSNPPSGTAAPLSTPQVAPQVAPQAATIAPEAPQQGNQGVVTPEQTAKAFNMPTGPQQQAYLATVSQGAPTWLQKQIQRSAKRNEGLDAMGIGTGDQQTAGQAFVTGARGSLLPAGGGLGGAALGGYVGLAGGPFAPVTVPVGAAIGGLLGSLGTSYAQDKMIEKYMNPTTKAEMDKLAAQGRQQHPLSAFSGEMAPYLAIGKPSITASADEISFIRQATKEGFKAALKDHPERWASVLNTSVGAGSQVGQVIHNRAVNGDTEAGMDIAAIALAAMGSKPTQFGKAIDSVAFRTSQPKRFETPVQDGASKEVKRVLTETDEGKKQALIASMSDNDRVTYNEALKERESNQKIIDALATNDPKEQARLASLLPPEARKTYDATLKAINANQVKADKAIPPSVRESTTRLENARDTLRQKNYIRPYGRVAEDIASDIQGLDNMANVAGEQAGNSLRLGNEPKRSWLQRAFGKVHPANDRLNAATIMREVQNIMAKEGPTARPDPNQPNGGLFETKPGEDVFADADKASQVQELLNRIKSTVLSPSVKENNAMSRELVAAVKHAANVDEQNKINKVVADATKLLQAQEMIEREKLGAPISGDHLNSDWTFGDGKSFLDHVLDPKNKVRSINLADLVAERIAKGQKALNTKAWAESLISDGARMPGNKLPVARPGNIDAGDKYIKRSFQGVELNVLRDWAPYIESLMGTANPAKGAWKMAIEAEKISKMGKLLLDTYHFNKMAFYHYMLTGKGLDTKGELAAIQYTKQDIARAVELNLLTPDQAAKALEKKSIIENHIKAGANLSRMSKASGTEFAHTFRGVGQFTEYLFNSYVKGAMADVLTTKYQEMKQAHPDWDDNKIVRENSRNVNVMFGNLQKQGWIKTPDMKRAINTAFLAEEWVESGLKREAGALGGIIRGPARQIREGTIGTKNPWAGETLTKFQAKSVAYMVVATQLFNLLVHGKYTWENDDLAHKMDAYIPNLNAEPGDPQGFYFNPLTMGSEISHDMYRYYLSSTVPVEKHPIGGRIHRLLWDAPLRVLSNKISPILRSSYILATGHLPNGSVAEGAGRITGAAAEISPIPFLGSPGLNNQPGAWQRQVTASLGAKTEPESRAVTDINREAQKFMADMGKGKSTEISPIEGKSYKELDFALRNIKQGDLIKLTWELGKSLPRNNSMDIKASAAYNALDELRRREDDDQILDRYAKAIDHPFTGSSEMEDYFQQKLSPRLQKVYENAVQEKQDIYDKLQDLMDNHPNMINNQVRGELDSVGDYPEIK